MLTKLCRDLGVTLGFISRAMLEILRRMPACHLDPRASSSLCSSVMGESAEGDSGLVACVCVCERSE